MKNLERMSFDELCRFRERLLDLIDQKVKLARRHLERQIEQLDVLVNGGRRTPGRISGRPHALLGRRIAPRYRGPNGETWAGRGMMPVWLREQIKRGRKVEQFAISNRGNRKRSSPRKKRSS